VICVIDQGTKDGFLLLFDQPSLGDIAQPSLISINLNLPGIKATAAIDEKKITYGFRSEGL